MTKKIKDKKWIGFVMIGILIISCTIFIYSNMARKTCHTEKSIEKIELRLYHGEWSWESNCENYVGKITCESGVTNYNALGKVCNNEWQTEKVCLVQKKEKICELDL